jgi:hypothetical protein
VKTKSDRRTVFERDNGTDGGSRVEIEITGVREGSAKERVSGTVMRRPMNAVTKITSNFEFEKEKKNILDCECAEVQLGAERGSTVTRAQTGEEYTSETLATDDEPAIPAKQIKCVPTEQLHGFQEMATDVNLEGVTKAYKYKDEAPTTPWFKFPATKVEFGGWTRETTKPNMAGAESAESIDLLLPTATFPLLRLRCRVTRAPPVPELRFPGTCT